MARLSGRPNDRKPVYHGQVKEAADLAEAGLKLCEQCTQLKGQPAAEVTAHSAQSLVHSKTKTQGALVARTDIFKCRICGSTSQRESRENCNYGRWMVEPSG